MSATKCDAYIFFYFSAKRLCTMVHHIKCKTDHAMHTESKRTFHQQKKKHSPNDGFWMRPSREEYRARSIYDAFFGGGNNDYDNDDEERT